VPLDETRDESVERWALETVEARHEGADHEEHRQLGARQERVRGQGAGADGQRRLGDLDEPATVEGVGERAADEKR
jgi:hypothetical protein